jgi:cytochrome c oxidase cbb3-type subunit III
LRFWTILFLAASVPLAAQPPANRPASGGQQLPGGRVNTFLISRSVPDPAAVERGKKSFVATCGFCHGSNANGGEGGPDLIRSPLALNDEGGDKIGPVIVHGRPEKGMPAFPMTDDQVKDIAAFLRSRQQAAIDRSSYVIQNIVTGDAKRGEAYFNGVGRCNECHSATGDLAGIAKKYDPVALQGRFLYPQTRTFPGQRAAPSKHPALVTVTVDSGQKVSGILEAIDDFNVSLREASGEYRSFSRTPDMKVEIRDPLAAHEQLLSKYTDADMHDILAYLVTLK